MAHVLPDEDTLAKYLYLLYAVMIQARSRAGERQLVADLMDAVENIPDLLLRWPDMQEHIVRKDIERIEATYPGLKGFFSRILVEGAPSWPPWRQGVKDHTPDEKATDRPAAQPLNQCDGCLAGRPVDKNGMHRMGDGEYPDLMLCQKAMYADYAPPKPPKPRRQAGTLKGQIALTDAFFEPMPDDELALWNGESPDPSVEAAEEPPPKGKRAKRPRGGNKGR